MAEFDPVPPPLNLPAVPDVLSPDVPLNPPMVGNASPWIPVDGQNRDLILASIRAWVYRSLLPWTTAWQTQLTDWEQAIEDQLDAWMVLADSYITAHAVAGLSFRTTVTDIAGTGTTNVTLVTDPAIRPIVLGDLVLDQSADGNYGTVTALIDDTHATVTYTGTLRGPNGLSFRSTASAIAGAGTSDVVLPVIAGYAPLVDDLVVDSASGNYGQITVVTDSTHVTVAYLGSIKGPKGDKGDPGDPGVVQSVVAGSNVTVDSTDPAHPIVSASAPGSRDKAKGLVLGTDISLGTATGGVSWVDDYPAAYAQRTPGSPAPIVLTNQAVSGATSVDELATLTAHIDDTDYGFVFIEMPYTDYGNVGGITITQTISALTQMIRLCLDRGVTPVVIGSAPWNPSGGTSFAGSTYRWVTARIEAIRLTSLLGVPYVNMAARATLNTDNQTDGLLPTLLGQSIWAAGIAATVASMGGDDLFDDFTRPNSGTSMSPALSGHSWDALGGTVWGINANKGKIVTPVTSAGHLDMAVVQMSSSDQVADGVITANQGGIVLRNTGVNTEGYFVDFRHGRAYWSVGGSSSQLGSDFTPPTAGQHFEISVKNQLVSGTPEAAITVTIDGTVVVSVFDTNIMSGTHAGLCDTSIPISQPDNSWGDLALMSRTYNNLGGVPVGVGFLAPQS